VFRPTIQEDICRQIRNITAWANLSSFIFFDVHIFNRLFVRRLYDYLQLLTLKQFIEWLKRLSHAKFKSCGWVLMYVYHWPPRYFRTWPACTPFAHRHILHLPVQENNNNFLSYCIFKTSHYSKFTSLYFLEVCPSCYAWFRHFPSFLYIHLPWDRLKWKRFSFELSCQTHCTVFLGVSWILKFYSRCLQGCLSRNKQQDATL
jgi:hypothetical protein